MSDNKFIASIKRKAEAKIEALRSEANEAYLNWADTGYERYSKKSEKLAAEADEIDGFIHPERNFGYYRKRITELEAQNFKLHTLMKSVCNVQIGMKSDFPDCAETRELEHIASVYKFEVQPTAFDATSAKE